MSPKVLTLPVRVPKPALCAKHDVKHVFEKRHMQIIRSRYTTWLPWRTILFCNNVAFDGNDSQFTVGGP